MQQQRVIEPPEFPIGAYGFANLVCGLKRGDEGYNDPGAAVRAWRTMRQAGWRFQGYNDYGEETFLPPEPEPCSCGYPAVLVSDGYWYCSVCGRQL